MNTEELTIREIVTIQDYLGKVLDELETERRKKAQRFKALKRNLRRVKIVV